MAARVEIFFADVITDYTGAPRCPRRLITTGAPVSAASRLEGIPCRDCTAPEADDVRFRAGQISDVSELQLSPGGFPVGCCKRVTLAVIGGQPDRPSAPARRMGRRY